MSLHLTDAALSAHAYGFLLSSYPRTPTIPPNEFFAAPLQAGQGDLRKAVDPTRFYGQLYVGRQWWWTRDDLFFVLAGPTYTEAGFGDWLQTAVERDAQVAQAMNQPAEPWPIEASWALLHQDQEHILHYSFAQENLETWVALEDGTQHPLSEFYVDSVERQGNGSSPAAGEQGNEGTNGVTHDKKERLYATDEDIAALVSQILTAFQKHGGDLGRGQVTLHVSKHLKEIVLDDEQIRAVILGAKLPESGTFNISSDRRNATRRAKELREANDKDSGHRPLCFLCPGIYTS